MDRRDFPPLERPRRDNADEFEMPRRRHYSPLIIFSIAIFAVAAFYLGLVVVTQADQIFLPGNELGLPVVKSLPGVDSGNTPDFADINERINIVLLGLDQRRDEPDDQPYRTDTVMILTIDPYSKTAGAFSIPRDTLVQIPDGYGGYTEDRINVAYELGEYMYRGYPGGGAGLVKDTIEYNFEIPIDHYVVLNFNSFIEIVDELGGITVDVPEYVYDPAYSDCNRCAYRYVEFVPGPQQLDGETALAYARLRHSDNDFKRIERQQLVIKAMARRASDIGVLLGSNPINLYKKYKESVKTDISDIRAAGLALLGKQIGPDNIHTVSMQPATYPCTGCSASVLLWDPQKLEELKAQVFSDGRLQTEQARVEVLNGTPVPDLAGDFASFLRGQGLPSEQIAVDEYAGGELYDETLIIDLSGKSYTVSRLAQWLGLPGSRVLTASDPRSAPFIDTVANVVVVLGKDVDLPDPAMARTGG